MKFKQNEGMRDKALRALVALILAVVSYTNLEGTARIVVLVIAAILLFTAITGYCALYSLLGINTKHH
jgi:hypothetical protein